MDKLLQAFYKYTLSKKYDTLPKQTQKILQNTRSFPERAQVFLFGLVPVN